MQQPCGYTEILRKPLRAFSGNATDRRGLSLLTFVFVTIKPERIMQYHEIGKTGMKVSSLSFGASSLGGVFHDIKEKEAIEAVFTLSKQE